MTLEQLTERVRISGHVSLQELGIRRAIGWRGRSALLRRDEALGLPIVWIRSVLPPVAVPRRAYPASDPAAPVVGDHLMMANEHPADVTTITCAYDEALTTTLKIWAAYWPLVPASGGSLVNQMTRY